MFTLLYPAYQRHKVLIGIRWDAERKLYHDETAKTAPLAWHSYISGTIQHLFLSNTNK